MITLEKVKKALKEKAKVVKSEDQKMAERVIGRCEEQLSQGVLVVYGLTRNERAVEIAVKYFTGLGFKVAAELKTFDSRSTKKKNYEYSMHTLTFSVD